ncbi:MAG: RNA-binding S4 domain-containing protein [Cyanobacteria bacterium P01_G01_bin.38]
MAARSYIKLDQFLKLVQVTSSGGQAKVLIQEGWVFVNGDLELRRGRKLVDGDQVTFEEQTFTVKLAGEASG